MNTKKAYVYALLTTILLLFAGFSFYSPYLAAKNMKKYAENSQTEKLNNLINYPLLKENLKNNFNKLMLEEVEKKRAASGKERNPTAEMLGAAIVSAIAGPVIDALITPDNLAKLIKNGEKPEFKLKSLKENKENKSSFDSPPKKHKIKSYYQDYYNFVIDVFPDDKFDQEEKVSFILSRTGFFSWQLINIKFNIKNNSSQKPPSNKKIY